MAYQASPSVPVKAERPSQRGNSPVWLMLVATFLGIAVGVMAIIGLWLAISASQARDDAQAALAKVEQARPASAPMAEHQHGATATAALQRPRASPGSRRRTPTRSQRRTRPIRQRCRRSSPGRCRGQAGHPARDDLDRPRHQVQRLDVRRPRSGPVIHVRQGQTVKVALTNNAPMPHSVDFHAARVAPNVAFTDVMPGETKTFSFVANDPGVFMYHCGTKPVLAHIANGMYGAIVVEPKQALPAVDHQYVLVSSEWYLTSPGSSNARRST